MFEKIPREKLDRLRTSSESNTGRGSERNKSIKADLDYEQFDAEALVRAFMKNPTVAMFIKDLGGRYVLVNAMCERLWRLPADQIKGRTDRDILPERDAQRLIANDRQVIDTGQPIEFEEYIDFPGGRRVFATAKMPIRDRFGELSGLCGVATEVTARISAEARLLQSERRLRRMVRVEGFGALVLDASGTLIHANKAFLDMLGYSREGFEVNTLTWRAITPPEYIELSERQWHRLEETGQIGPYEKEVLHKDGSRSWMMFTGTSLGDGTVIKYCMDISSRKRAEDALRESDRAKDRFLAVLSHELRNPLAPLRAGLDLLEQAERTAVIDDVRSMMDRQLSHLIRLVDDLLDVSRISQGKLTLRRAPLDLNVTVGVAVEQTSPLLSERGHVLSVDFSDASLSVTGDMERLTQVIANLLSNAARYTEPGGTISLRTEAEESDAVVRVRDMGCGIPSGCQDSIFTLFSQLPKLRNQPSGGLGIGLALSRQLIEMHGGSIEARSEGLGHGSEFIVRLPLTSGEPPAATEPVPDDTSDRARRVLVVDDNIDAADGLRKLLELKGHAAEVAHDGPAALEQMDSFAPEVVLLDLGLPGMDGYEVARRIRTMPGRDEVLMVAITGWGQEEDRRRTKDAGFDEHLIKPVDFAQLSSLIRNRH